MNALFTIFTTFMLACTIIAKEPICSKQFQIERASLSSDLPQIARTICLAYQKQFFNKKDYTIITSTQLESLLQEEANHFYVLISNEEKICGTIMLRGCEISRFSIHPDYQGRGLGQLLLHHVEKEAFQKYPAVFLKVIPLFQNSLIHYYESLGYRSFGEIEPLPQEKLNRIQEKYHPEVYALIMRKEHY